MLKKQQQQKALYFFLLDSCYDIISPCTLFPLLLVHSVSGRFKFSPAHRLLLIDTLDLLPGLIDMPSIELTQCHGCFLIELVRIGCSCIFSFPAAYWWLLTSTKRSHLTIPLLKFLNSQLFIN